MSDLLVLGVDGRAKEEEYRAERDWKENGNGNGSQEDDVETGYLFAGDVLMFDFV